MAEIWAGTGELLRRHRLRSGLTQEQLSERAGVSVRALRDLERGRARPRSSSVLLLAAALGLTEHDRAALVDPGPRGLVPAQLPADQVAFVGREPELRELDGILAGGGAPIAALVGMPGVGKSALAVRWAHRVADRYPDGQLFCNLRGYDPVPVEPQDALRRLLSAFGVSPDQLPADPDDRSALLRSHLAGRRMVLLLDNARSADQVRPLLPGGPGCAVLVTSRRRLDGLVAGESARHVAVEPLAAGQAVELLGRIAGPDRIAAEPVAAARLAAACGRLPLALRLVAALLARHPRRGIAVLSEQLDLLRADDEHTVHAAFDASVRQLPVELADLFALLGLHPGPDVGPEAAAALTGRPLSDTRRGLDALVDRHLLTEQADGRYALHDLLRVYAAELVGHRFGPDDRRAATGRLLDYYLFTADRAEALLNPVGVDVSDTAFQVRPPAHVPDLAGYDAALRWTAMEMENLVAASRYAAGAGFDEHAWRLPRALAAPLRIRAAWRELVELGDLALDAAKRLVDTTAESVTLDYRAMARYFLGVECPVLADLARAATLAAAAGDTRRAGRYLANRALALTKVGRAEEALSILTDLLAVAAGHGDLGAEANLLNSAAGAHVALGDYPAAVDVLRRVLASWTATGDVSHQAGCWTALGEALLLSGDVAGAGGAYQRALALGIRIRSADRRARALDGLARVAAGTGRRQRAVALWRRAWELSSALGAPEAEGIAARLARYTGEGGAPGTAPPVRV